MKKQQVNMRLSPVVIALIEEIQLTKGFKNKTEVVEQVIKQYSKIELDPIRVHQILREHL